MKLRAIAVAIASAAMAMLVVRVALVEANASKDPAEAAKAWPGHPSVILNSGLAEIGSAASQGQGVDRRLVGRVIAAATKAPMAPEPYLVRGVDASIQGREELAGRAFQAARNLDPRSVAARYFLAGHYLKIGETRAGLSEISALARLVPQSLTGIGPTLAAYARDIKATAQVRELLRRDPALEPVVLGALAGDARDAPLAISLWTGKGSRQLQPWQSKLLDALINAGSYREAYSFWKRFTATDGKDSSLSDFSGSDRGPFGWTLASGPSGVAEPLGDEGLRVLFYGRDDALMASRILMLQPGHYRLSMRLGGMQTAKAMAWVVRCLPSSAELARVKLAGSGLILGSFNVPSGGCEAQRLDLVGSAPELPAQAEVTITALDIVAGDRL